jgi:hypothetical protein
MRLLSLAFACCLAAACSGPDPVAEDTNSTEALPTVNEPSPDTTGAPPRTTSGTALPATNAATPTAATGGTKIPKVLHGRWGLTPADCAASGAAEGLLVISAEAVRFYESRGVPAANVSTATDSISGDFQFTGEGQSWTKFVALERRPDGLVRTERNPNVSLTYARCD